MYVNLDFSFLFMLLYFHCVFGSLVMFYFLHCPSAIFGMADLRGAIFQRAMCSMNRFLQIYSVRTWRIHIQILIHHKFLHTERFQTERKRNLVLKRLYAKFQVTLHSNTMPDLKRFP